MSDFDKYWAELCEKNPGLKVPDLRLSMTVESLQSQIKRAYESGVRDQKKLTDALAKMKDRLGGSSSIFGDLFK